MSIVQDKKKQHLLITVPQSYFRVRQSQISSTRYDRYVLMALIARYFFKASWLLAEVTVVGQNYDLKMAAEAT